MNQQGLKKVLRLNAGFSILSGLALLIDAAQLSDIFGQVNPWIFRGIGIGLLMFAADMLVTCSKPEIPRPKALYFSIGDFGWVAGSAVLLIAVPLSTLAAGLVIGVALMVLGFGIQQLRQLRVESHS